MQTDAWWITVGSIAHARHVSHGKHEEMRAAHVFQSKPPLELRAMGPTDVLVEVLFAAAEHNILHAALASPINIAELRGGEMVPGNCAVFHVLEVGTQVARFKPGDIAISHCNGGPDRFGFPNRIWGYDAEDSVGWYAKHAVVGEWQLIPAPLSCGLSIEEITALPLRAPTAYYMWKRALAVLRSGIPEEALPKLNVLTFGGGVSECFAMLAKSQGHDVWYCAGSPHRRADMERLGIGTIDQMAFSRFGSPDDVSAFRAHLRGIAPGGIHIVADMFRGPTYNAGLAVMARGGVNVSAGWQLGKDVQHDSAQLSVRQLTLLHTHYAPIPDCEAATALYGSVFRPTIHPRIFSFGELPRAFDLMQRGTMDGTPIIQVADVLPEAVAHMRYQKAA